MKTKFLLFAALIAIAFCFTSCSKDDNDSSGNLIVGTWVYTAYNGSETVTFTSKGKFHSVAVSGGSKTTLKGSYTYNPYTEALILDVDGGDGYIYYVEFIAKINGRTMVLTSKDTGTTTTYTKK